MPQTILKNPVNVNVGATAVSLYVTGTPEAATGGGGVKPSDTLLVEGTAGQETSGVGQSGGAGADVSITAGTGGRAPNGSSNGDGGTVKINPGAPGAGAGNAASYGKILLAPDGGSVGIGTTTPDISGIGASAATLTVHKSGGRGNLELATNVDSNGASVGTLTFTNSQQSTSAKRVAEVRALEEGTTAQNRGGRLSFGTRSDGASDVSTRMIISQAGLVALGNYTPAVDLDITKNASGSRTEIRLSNISNTSNSRAFMDIHVAGSAAGNPVLNFGVSSVVSWAAGIDNADNQKLKINAWTGSSVNDGFSGTNVLTMLISGNVGVGTTSPTSKLHVAGGVQVGSPVGGDKGTGSINVANDVYRNGTPLFAMLDKACAQISALTKRLDKLEKMQKSRPSKQSKPSVKVSAVKAKKKKAVSRSAIKGKR
jgi:hypothetical protein